MLTMVIMMITDFATFCYSGVRMQVKNSGHLTRHAGQYAQVVSSGLR
jgi:hypothetical protein